MWMDSLNGDWRAMVLSSPARPVYGSASQPAPASRLVTRTNDRSVKAIGRAGDVLLVSRWLQCGNDG